MEYHIPTDEQVIDALRRVMTKHTTVTSQHRLKSLVEKELHAKQHHYQVGESRLRLLSLQSGIARIEIYSRDGDPDKLLHRCPVCSSPLERVKNQTLYGGEVTLEYKCSSCGYWTGKKKKIPTLYIFHRR
jgi:hypothetical protein